MSNCSNWPIVRILSGTTNLVQSGPGSDGNEGVIPKALLEPRYQMVSCHIRTLVGGGALTPLQSVQADLSNAVVWMILIPNLVSNSSCLFSMSFGDGSTRTKFNWYHRHFHVPLPFYLSGTTQVLIYYVDFFYFHSLVRRDGKSHWMINFLFYFTRFGRLVEIRWSVCISKSQRILCISFSCTDSGLSICHLIVW